MASDKKRKRDKVPALSEDETARRERKKQRKAEKKERKRKAKEQPASTTPGGKKGKYEKSAEKRQKKREQKEQEGRVAEKGSAKSADKGKANASTTSHNPFASPTSHNPFAASAPTTTRSVPFTDGPADNLFAAAAAASTSGPHAPTFPPGFDFEATKRHLLRKRDSGSLSAEDKSLLASIEKHIASPGYVAPVKRTPKPRAAQEGASSHALSAIASGSGGTRISTARTASGKVSESKDLTLIDATGLSNEEVLAEKQYSSKQLAWLQEERKDLKIRWGRFGKEEADAVEKRLVEWEQENDMDRETTISLIFDREKRDVVAYNTLLKALTYAVPHRCFDTVRRYVRTHYEPLARQGPWTAEELEKLRGAVAKYKNDWAKVSAVVGRSRVDCRLYVRDYKQKVEGPATGGGATRESTSTPGTRNGDDDVDQLDSDVEMSQEPSSSQSQRRVWTDEETLQLKQAIASIVGTEEAKGRGPSDARFPWKLVAERMQTTRPPTKVHDRWQRVQAKEVRRGLIPIEVARNSHDSGGEEDEEGLETLLKSRYNPQRDDYLFVKSLRKAKEALDFDDIAAVDWKRVAEDLQLPNAKLRTIYTRAVTRYLGKERIDSSLRGVLADLKGPTKAAREAFLGRPNLRSTPEGEREYQRLKKRRHRMEARQNKVDAGLKVRKSSKAEADDDLIDSEEEG